MNQVSVNRYAYHTTALAIRALSGLLQPTITLHDTDNIPADNPVIFVINHFTRAETLLVPYHLNRLTNRAIWALADQGLFKGGFGSFLEKIGGVSTAAPDRDRLIVKSLLTNEAAWVIFPEGRMVKNKKIYDVVDEKGQFIISSSVGKHPPHTGAATLALRTEFYRERIKAMLTIYPDEAQRLMELYQIESPDQISNEATCIVPVNVTYYPIRARENILSNLARGLFENISQRTIEEIKAEGTMLMSGVDIDLRFGEPINVAPFLKPKVIKENIELKARFDFSDSISAKKMMRTTAVHLMERYMAAIYNMTTVNHDHIFASLLKEIPGNEIEEDDLRRRGFLAVTTLDPVKDRIYKHTCLNRSQAHLLTDDRYKRFDNFIQLAEETGIIERHGNTLIKKEAMRELPEFHKARVENPVAVIANEVEPLGELQKAIQALAKKSPNQIQKETVTNLIKKADFEFEMDYANYFIESESKKKNVGRPFLLRGEPGTTGIVLIHGYMAAPLEIRGLAQHLNALGHTVYAVRLRGHGTSPIDLATRQYEEWIQCVEEGYIIIKNICEHVIIGGFSMGAGLALELASRVSKMDGMVAISPPLKLQDFSAKFVSGLNLWNRLMKRINRDQNQKEFVENNPENPHINYTRNPLSGIRELGKLMEKTESQLTDITAPTLIIQSHADPVVKPRGARKIFEKISSPDKEFLLVNYARHGIVDGDQSQRIHAEVGDFIERVTSPELRDSGSEETTLPGPDAAA
jgi:esterase/lipase/1-acyl-sn-glycerol-3-phosphate acyltransferase